jgi:hypothetical protein
MFVYDIALQTWERFIPIEALGETGGCTTMLAHNVTEAAAV